MRIKRLDITGFKSFMDRVVFSFDDGITGVVGPNGCGKSNVVDAIRWAMGEQSAKNLRGRGMEDVIFNGSETHPPLSMAEVTLTFAVEAQDVLPSTLAGLPEVSVTRRLFRSGESEYQINRTTCRLLDVTELFLGTGVGTRAYSIIEQGRVGQIVSARPEDRRSFIEEAAGITRYKARRRAAERKLEYTRTNLQRVNDIVLELDRRLASLERQAKKAEKYQRLKAEIRELELALFSHRFQSLSGSRVRVSAELEQLTRSEREAAEAAEGQETALAALRERLATCTAALELKTQELHALESQAQLEAQSVLHLSDDQAAAQERLVAVEAELQALAARRAALAQDQADADRELQGLAVSSREDEVLLSVKAEEHRRAVALQGEIVRRLEEERSQVVVLATRIANHLGTLAALEQRAADAAARGVQLDQEVAQLKAEEAQLEAARREVLDRVEQHRMVTLELTQRRGAEEDTLKRVREAFAENEVMVTALREDLADKKSRLGSLQEIARNYEGYDRGVRAVMAQVGAEPRQAGVFGVVADVISAPPELEKAIEGALGERLQHIVVETPERGFELVAHLRALAEGRSTFLPVPASPAPVHLVPVPQALGLAVDRVSISDPVLRPVVETLLAGVVLVPDLEAARAAAALVPDGVYVTLDGEVLRPGGVVTGGALEGPAIGALQKKREIAELSAQVAHLEERYNEIITRHYELQKQLGHSEGVLKGLERNRHQEELSLTGHEKDLHQAGSSLARLRERIAQLSQERAQVEEARSGHAYEAEAARGEAAHGQADRALREERVRLMGSELESLQGRLDALAGELTQLKVKVASVAERGEAARMRVDSLAAQASELAQRVEARERAGLEDRERLALLEQKLQASAEGLPQRVEALEHARRAVEGEREVHARLTPAVAEDDRALKELRTLLETLGAGRTQAALKDRELELELEHLAAQVQERYQLSMAEAMVLRQHAPTPDATAAATLEDLKRSVERLGEVNVTAIEEHRELAERHGFLSGQRKDLSESLDRLTQAIEKIDVTSRARFQETFEIVNDKFQQVFPRLFGGGRASLTLVPGVAGEEPGVEILAQPPGKKLQSVSLFSGGEKALTAVALIFAIFLIKPTPFCLLDEVDAPLDEGNVGRYNEMVREMSSGSQFILITHNKRTMEVVDALYGVTMEEPGVSKLVSVKLKDAAAANGDQQVA